MRRPAPSLTPRLARALLAASLAVPLADTASVADFPEALALSPDGRRVAVVSNTAEASVVQLVDYAEGRFGAVTRVDLASLGITGQAAGARGGVTATNVQWHPSGRYLAVNLNTQNRVAFLAVSEGPQGPVLRPWGEPVAVGADPFVGRYTPDGRHYLTANWGRDFSATTLEGRLPTRASTLSVIRLADPDAPGQARHALVAAAESGPSSEGLAISPDGRLVATINMGTTALDPASPRFRREASVSLLALDPRTGALEKLSDTPFVGVLPEGGAFDTDGGHFLATVFEGHADAGPDAGPGLAVFRVEPGARPALAPLGRIPLPHGVHHVELAR